MSQIFHLLFETPKKISKVTFSETIQASIKPAKSSWLHQVAKDLLDPNVDCERGELSLFTVPILKHAIFIPYFS